MIVDRGDDVRLDLNGLWIQRVAVDRVGALGEFIVEIARAKVLRVHLGGHSRAVAVPHQEVEGGRFLTEEPVVGDVLKHEVVGAQHVKDVRHVLALKVTRLIHLLFETGDRGFVGEETEDSRNTEVRVGVKEGGRTQ